MRSRFFSMAAAVCLSALPIAHGSTTSPAAGAPGAEAPAAATPASSGDAAAKKHAKLTACLKEAREKKLVGTAKTSFVKNCAAAP